MAVVSSPAISISEMTNKHELQLSNEVLRVHHIRKRPWPRFALNVAAFSLSTTSEFNVTSSFIASMVVMTCAVIIAVVKATVVTLMVVITVLVSVTVIWTVSIMITVSHYQPTI